MSKRMRGFTLIELVITLAIVGLLASAAMPLAQLVAKREKEAELRGALRDIRTALDAYRKEAQTGHIKQELGASCAAFRGIPSFRTQPLRRKRPGDCAATKVLPMTHSRAMTSLTCIHCRRIRA
jgi:prepilin-type N-terminal cleavage/methylation domain-containing protein